MSTDRLGRLAEQLDGLNGRPLADHPAVLDEVHQALVDELDALTPPGAPPRG